MGFIWNYARNLVGLLAGQPPTRPLMFSFYLTHRCRLNCLYCCDGDGKRFAEEQIPELSFPEVKLLLQKLRTAADTLDLTGGEPMLRDDLEDILAYAGKIGFRTVLNTKGLGGDGETLRDRPQILQHCDVLVLSIDSLHPGSLARMLDRPQPVAEAVLSNLEVILAARGNSEAKFVISVVATPDNLDDLHEILAYCQTNGLGFQISPEIIGTHPNPALRHLPAYSALIHAVRRAKSNRSTPPSGSPLRRRGGGRRPTGWVSSAGGTGVLGIRPYLQGIAEFRSFPCHPLLMPVIRPDGRMYYPCLESKNAQVNILDHPTFESALAKARELWDHPKNGPACGACCHIFCHMALSLLQLHPFHALKEMKLWRSLDA